MRKAVLVMDMPSSCDKCPLFCNYYSDMTCRVNGKAIDYPYPKEIRQEWCPLCELPEKKPHTEDVLEVFINTGYNACIDELLKEE